MTDNKCIHCGLCRNSCEFLQKYNIDVTDIKSRPELAYHCFLCGKCTEVCPKGIDGNEIVIAARNELAKDKKNLKPYTLLIAEKSRYLFRNYHNSYGETVFFPGCNFLGFYPETTHKIFEMLNSKILCGIIYDCCGKPISDIGMEDEYNRTIDRFNTYFKNSGVEEIIVACPNCYSHFKNSLNIKVTSVYEKFDELGLGIKCSELEGKLFMPCPDRNEKSLLSEIQNFFDCSLNERLIQGVNCCGLGGCASKFEGEIASSFGEEIKKQCDSDLYTYCASCSSRLTTKEKDAKHILTVITGTNETADTKWSFFNRVKHTFRKEKK